MAGRERIGRESSWTKFTERIPLVLSAVLANQRVADLGKAENQSGPDKWAIVNSRNGQGIVEKYINGRSYAYRSDCRD